MVFVKLFVLFVFFGWITDCHPAAPEAEKASLDYDKATYFSPHDLCESEILAAEKANNIPPRLLLAIGTVESGRSIGGKKKRAWPWTICANLKSYYFSTKSAAVAAVKRFMARGIRNIDVGCMQVNLMHHSKAFRTLEEAFTPRKNVAYAAKYLLSLKKSNNSWTNAVGYYHSKSSKYYKPYCQLVYNEWKRVMNTKINSSLLVRRIAGKPKSKISFLPSFYSLMDSKISYKLHKLGRQSIVKKPPSFYNFERQ
ncbi:MAG: transglycosylase SLT domain-containing protein [Holosporaceae bacterium]|nr:transglycosylase SLT domain-containing protein [Holosporaceae bacterium]